MSGSTFSRPYEAVIEEEPRLAALLRTGLSAVFWLYFFVTVSIGAVVIGAVRLLLLPFDKSGRVAHRLTCFLSFNYLAVNPGWRIRFQDLHHLKSAKTFVMVANHQSMIDVLLLSGLHASYKWVAKAQVLRMLGVGHLLRVNQYVPVAPGDLRSVRRMMKRARRYLRAGTSMLIFPEGERTLDGDLMQFKDGPFRLACETNTAVLPIVLDGTMNILPRGQWAFKFSGDIWVKVLPPVYPAHYQNNAASMNLAVRMMIENELYEHRLSTAAAGAAAYAPAVERVID